MTSEGENNIKTANGDHEEYDEDPDFIQETEDLDQELALEAQDSFDQDPAYPPYLYEQEQRSGDKSRMPHFIDNLTFLAYVEVLITFHLHKC